MSDNNTDTVDGVYGLSDDDEELGAENCSDAEASGGRRNLHAALMRFILWRERHVKEKNFVLVLALFVGVFAGLAAMVLKWLIHTISGVLTTHINVDRKSVV